MNQQGKKKEAPKKGAGGKRKKGKAPVKEQAGMAAVAVSRKQFNRPPNIEFARDGSTCRVRHRERIGTILGSSAFTVNTFALNPGLFASFPWLSAIAQRFESYSFNKLCFEYRTKTATSATGDVLLTVDYDAAEAAPASSIQAESYKSAVSCAPWQDINWEAASSDLHKLKSNYCRAIALAANLDIKTYDIGNLFVCTENQAGANLVGYLYTEYDILFMTPELASDAANVILAGFISGNTTITAANPLGTAPIIDPLSLGVSADGTSLVTLTSVGEWIGFIRMTGTVITAMAETAVTNCVLSYPTGFAENINGAGTIAEESFRVVVASIPATFQLSATATTITGSSLIIFKQPTGMFA